MLDAVVTDAELTLEERIARQTQSAVASAYRLTSSDNPLDREFELGTGGDLPLTRLDIGGEDQEQRHVAFYPLLLS